MPRHIGLLAAIVALLALCGCRVGLDFSPDGRQLVVTSAKGLQILGTDGTPVKAIPGGEDGVMPSWSPDGSRILFIQSVEQKDSGREETLCLFTIAGNRTIKLGTGYEPPFGWREDGRQFTAMHLEANGARDIVWHNAADGSVIRRTRVPFTGADFRMVWLPSTDDVALFGDSGSGNDVYSVEAGELKRLSTTGDVIGLGLSADGKRLLWARHGPNLKYILMSVYQYDLTSRTVSRVPMPDSIPLINPDPRHAPSQVGYAAFSPDGQRLAILVEFGDQSKPEPRPDAFTGCYTLKLDGTDCRLVRRTAIGRQGGALIPFWSRDGSKLAIQDLEKDTTVVALFDADGRTGKRLLEERTQ